MSTIAELWGDEESDEQPTGQATPPANDLPDKTKAEGDADDGDADFLVFDIETGPLDNEALKTMLPEFVAKPPPGVFVDADVKLGNLKDPAKIKEKMDKAKADHADAVARYSADVAKARDEHWQAFVDKAALDATTGRVVAIGFTLHDWDDGPEIIDCDQDEAAGLRDWWAETEAAFESQIPIVGFNTHHFDLPFLVRRSWMLGVPIPMGVRQGRYWSPLFVDLMQVWGF
jgi:hypothetical protein